MTLRGFTTGEALRLVLFLGAGAINTVFGYGVFALFTALGLTGAAAVVLATVAGVMFNFRTFSAVFAARGLARLPHFVLTYAVLTPLNIALLAMARRAGLGVYLGEAAALCVVTPLTFLALRHIVFAPQASVPGRA